MNVIITYLACIVFLFIFGRVFFLPIKKVAKFFLNSIIGALLIYIINIVGASLGTHIGINVVTSSIIGFLGLPGAVLLVFLRVMILT